MANLRLIFAVLFLVSLLTAVFFWASTMAKESRISDAEDLSQSVHSYLRLVRDNCRAQPLDFRGMNECVEKKLNDLQEVDYIEEDDFENYDTETNESGFLIVVNGAPVPLDSHEFLLLHNKRVVDEGCDIPGTLGEGYVCKMHFDQVCERGDVLEVKYKETTAFLRVC